MKKLLSIFAIGGGILGSALPTVAACKLKTKTKPWTPIIPSKTKPWTPITPSKPTHLILSNLQIYNLDVEKNQTNLIINGQKAYLYIEDEIIKEYKTIFPKATLNVTNFNSGSLTLSQTQTWGIEIMNLDNKSIIKNLDRQNLIIPQNYHQLTDNALKIKIKTNDKNVLTTSSSKKKSSLKIATVNGYLNKFIYTNKNANNGKNVTSFLGETATHNHLLKANVIDFSSGKYNLHLTSDLLYNKKVNALEAKLFQQLDSAQKVLISKAIVTSLNNQLTKETKKLNALKRLQTANNDVQVADAFALNQVNTKLFYVDQNNEVFSVNSTDLGSQWKLFAKIDISKWNYLNNYLGVPNTYVYAYLGSVSKQTDTFNLNTIDFHNVHAISLVQGALDQPSRLVINGDIVYNRIVHDIVSKYKRLFWSQPKLISWDDFNLNSTTITAKKTWAVQIKNGNINIASKGNTNLGITNTQNLVNNDNSLSVVITTNNVNVVTNTANNSGIKTATVKAYLNPFVYNNQDANRGINVTAIPQETSARQQHLIKSDVVDFTTGTNNLGLHLTDQTTLKQLKTTLATKAKSLIISNAIIANVNWKFNTQMAYIKNHYHVHAVQKLTLQQADNFISKVNFKFFAVMDGGSNILTLKNSTSLLPFAKNFIQIKISHWAYLTENTSAPYLALEETYVYGYLGESV